MAINYVQFQRGTSAAFARLPVKDPNTLYFISEKDAKTGVLYLGDKLLTQACKLDNLNLSEAITEQSILVYNPETDQWEDKPLADLAPAVFAGAKDGVAGTAGLVPAPAPCKQNAYLKGDGTWANPTAEVEAALETLKGRVDDLSTAEVSYEIVDSLDDIENPKTNTIYLVRKPGADGINSCDEYLFINPDGETNSEKFERIGSTSNVSNNQYIESVDTNVFQVSNKQLQLKAVPVTSVSGLEDEVNTILDAKVGDLSQLLFSENNTTIVEEINSINERLVWQEIEEN